jgi:hypothetical protein
MAHLKSSYCTGKEDMNEFIGYQRWRRVIRFMIDRAVLFLTAWCSDNQAWLIQAIVDRKCER